MAYNYFFIFMKWLQNMASCYEIAFTLYTFNLNSCFGAVNVDYWVQVLCNAVYLSFYVSLRSKDF